MNKSLFERFVDLLTVLIAGILMLGGLVGLLFVAIKMLFTDWIDRHVCGGL